MKIAVQADGGIDIGMGHIMRTLVLSKELSKINEVFYICRVESKYWYDKYTKVSSLDQITNNEICSSKYIQGIRKILSEGFEVRLLNEEILIDQLKENEADLLITDSYFVREIYFEETKKIFKKTAYIDDTNKYYFNVDFLINQNIDAKDFHYKVNCDTRLLLGTDYLLLRDEFRNLQKKNIKDNVEDIMITIGGADPYKLTEKILNYVGKMDYKFHVIIGPSFDDTSFIEKSKNSNIRFYYNANMFEIMSKCDMAISACGSTLYELSACGVPTLGIIIADNQQGIAKKLNDMNIILNLGWYNKINKDDLINNINKLACDYTLRKCLSERASKLIDGKGVERMTKALYDYI